MNTCKAIVLNITKIFMRPRFLFLKKNKKKKADKNDFRYKILKHNLI